MAENPITPIPLDESWTYKITVLADRIAKRIAPIAMRVGGLNLSQWRVIAAIADKPGRFASQVVDITPMDKGIVSRAVATLVERDLIERRGSKADGRLSHLHLTDAGQQTFHAIMAELDAAHVSGRAVLPDADMTAFAARLDRLIADLDPKEN